MAQTGYTPILIYSSSTASNLPSASNLTNSTLGSELAINIADGKLFYKDTANAVQVIAWKTTPTTAGGTGLTTYTAGDLIYYASGSAFTKLGIGTAYQALQVNAGATAPSWQPSATSVLTAQGDLLYASAANTLERLAKNTTATRYLSNTGASNNPAWAQIDLTNGVTGALPAANGGTGQTSYAVGDILYASGSTTLSKLADVATGNALISGGVGVAPSWGKIGLTTHVSGTLPVANGGTNLTSYTANGLVYASGTTTLATSTGIGYDGTNAFLGTKTMPTVTGGRVQLINDCLIFAGDTIIGSPYTQNLQIDITWGNWSTNPAIALVEVAIAAREFAGTAGGAFGWLYATNGGGATFSTFVTTGITATQGTLTAASGGNYILRITFDPTSQTDRIGYTIRIPTMSGGTGTSVTSISATLV